MDSGRPDEQINIICLLWKGEFRERDYKDEDVVALREEVESSLKEPFNFFCLTNDMDSNIPATKIQLDNDWSGWWSKMELFRPDLPKGRYLYLDLDTHVIGDLHTLLEYKGDLVVFETPYNKAKYKKDKTKEIIQQYQTSTMLFESGSLSYIYHEFEKNASEYIAQYRSEQDLLADWLSDLPVFSTKYMQKMSSLRNNSIHSDTILVTGRPKGDSFRNPSFTDLNKEQ